MMKKTLLILVVLCGFIAANKTYAAYPLNNEKNQSLNVATSSTAIAEKNTATTASLFQSKRELKKEMSVKANSSYSGKSKTLAVVLAIFLGSFGVHSFYMGQTTKGFMQLGLTLLGFALVIVGAASVSSGETLPTTAAIGFLLVYGVAIWAFVDFIRILIGSLEPEEGFDS